MLEQSVTESDECGGTTEGACQAPNVGIVPGTEWRNCARHRMAELCQAPNGGIVPGTKRRNCAWHRTAKLYLAPNGEFVPGTEPRNGTRYNPIIYPHDPMHKKTPGNRIKSSPKGLENQLVMRINMIAMGTRMRIRSIQALNTPREIPEPNLTSSHTSSFFSR